MRPIPIAGPAVEPVTVTEMQGVLRLDDGAEEAFVAALILAARRHVEDVTGRRLIEQRWRVMLERWPPGRVVALPLSPVMAIERVRVAGPHGEPEDLAVGRYRLSASDPPCLVVDPATPAPGPTLEGVVIDVVAGYGATAAEVPAPLVQAIRLLVARWFEHRGDGSEAARPADVLALLSPYRARRIA